MYHAVCICHLSSLSYLVCRLAVCLMFVVSCTFFICSLYSSFSCSSCILHNSSLYFLSSTVCNISSATSAPSLSLWLHSIASSIFSSLCSRRTPSYLLHFTIRFLPTSSGARHQPSTFHLCRLLLVARRPVSRIGRRFRRLR